MSRREISLSEAGPREGAHPPVLALRIVWRRRAAQCEPSLIVIACSTFTDMDSMMIPYCPLHFAAIESVDMLLRVDGRRRRETSAAAAAMLLSFVGRLQPSTFCVSLCMESTWDHLARRERLYLSSATAPKSESYVCKILPWECSRDSSPGAVWLGGY